MNRKIITNALLLMAVFSASLLSFAAEGEEDVIGHSAGFYYTVKEGDTLWDLSKRFSDSHWQWPELWKYNSHIANPHLIYPGQKIRLFQKDWVDKITYDAPPEADESVAEPVKETPFFSYPSIDSVGFIRKEPVLPSGTIFKVKDDKEMISKGDTVYLKPMAYNMFKPGSEFSTYRTIGPIKAQNKKENIGTQYYITGRIKITESHPRSGFAMGTVIQSYRTIVIGELLIPYYPKSSKIPLVDNVKQLEGRIIASEEHSEIIGDNTIAFVDKGEDDGVQVGQMYSIYYQEMEEIDSKTNEEVWLPPVDFGEILILHTESTTATALITSAKRAIHPGAKVHSSRSE